MDILYLLIPLSVLLALAIGAAFWWALHAGQFDDLEGPAHRILTDDESAGGVLAAAPSAAGDREREVALDQSPPARASL